MVAKFLNVTFRKRCIDRIEPAMMQDVDDMIRGRVVWRRVSGLFEVVGRSMALLSTVLAYSASSELTAGTVSRSLAFASGACGTVGIVSTLFSHFARNESSERTTAMNSILQEAGIQKIPDIMNDLEIQETSE